MDISTELLQYYLAFPTVGLLDTFEERPQALADYDAAIRTMHERARRFGEEDALRRGLAYLLTHPEFDVLPLMDNAWTYDQAEARELIRYVYRTLWPGDADADGVRLVSEDLQTWRRQHATGP